MEEAAVTVSESKDAAQLGLADCARGVLRECILAVPQEFMLMDIAELRQRVKPNSNDYYLRANFWKEFQRVTDPGNQGAYLSPSKIYKEYNKATFYEVIRNTARLAFIIRPIKDYEDELNQMMPVAADRLWELINMPVHKYIFPKKGVCEKVMDHKAAEIVLKTIQMLENRTKGMAVQRIAQKTQTEHKHVVQAQTETPAQLDAKIAQLQGQMKELPGDIIEVEEDRQESTS